MKHLTVHKTLQNILSTWAINSYLWCAAWWCDVQVMTMNHNCSEHHEKYKYWGGTNEEWNYSIWHFIIEKGHQVALPAPNSECQLWWPRRWKAISGLIHALGENEEKAPSSAGSSPTLGTQLVMDFSPKQFDWLAASLWTMLGEKSTNVSGILKEH